MKILHQESYEKERESPVNISIEVAFNFNDFDVAADEPIDTVIITDSTISNELYRIDDESRRNKKFCLHQCPLRKPIMT